MKQQSFITACMDYFGKKQGQTLHQFRDEVHMLSPEDRRYFTKHFRSVGYEIIEREKAA